MTTAARYEATEGHLEPFFALNRETQWDHTGSILFPQTSDVFQAKTQFGPKETFITKLYTSENK